MLWLQNEFLQRLNLNFVCICFAKKMYNKMWQKLGLHEACIVTLTNLKCEYTKNKQHSQTPVFNLLIKAQSLYVDLF